MLTTHFVTGAPNWIDVGAPDLEGAVAFYGGLFGWEFRSAGPDAGGYGFFQRDGRVVAGGVETAAEQAPPAWTVYFQSEDAQATAEAAEQTHGSVLVQPTDVMDKGRMAVLADPAGAVFGIWQPGRRKGVDLAGRPGSLTWVELYTPDVAASAAFYHRTLGLETSAVPFPGGTYTCVNPAEGGEEAMFGGIVRPSDEVVGTGRGAYWLPYFDVEDTDAVVTRARELGGTVTTPATTVEGVGRMAELADPYGARFAVIRSEPPQE
ncbi:VOC family protein [Streptomyces sp. V3I7]|uniref:VOC family protein n=1 Tax=Streptomyces sp. V3I7 TaxID=3042278 RepID=UPI0027889878|nr:VOC family protein [Streptomyces sp. V3I7]MDQ0994109.1 putative enzyme related to lactoylglutathione lyase [Streptomyces sp. V3I7]